MISQQTIDRTHEILTKPLGLLTGPKMNRTPQRLVELNYSQFLIDCSDEDFIRLAYNLVMGRPASPKCLTDWSYFLSNVGTRPQLIHEFVKSDEGQSRKVHVYGLKYVMNVNGIHQPFCRWPWNRPSAAHAEAIGQVVRMAEIAEHNEAELQRSIDERQSDILDVVADLQRQILQLNCSLRNANLAQNSHSSQA